MHRTISSSILLCAVQDEVETGREELTFKSHRINDLEQALRQEKEHSTSLTTEMQVLSIHVH